MYDTKKNAPAPTTAAKAAFDRSVCFTCFGDYVDTLKAIADQSGAEIAYAAFEIAESTQQHEQPPPWLWNA